MLHLGDVIAFPFKDASFNLKVTRLRREVTVEREHRGFERLWRVADARAAFEREAKAAPWKCPQCTLARPSSARNT